jgi:F0F1-type ATP synthase assembly protein I
MQKHHSHLIAGIIIGGIVGYFIVGYFNKPAVIKVSTGAGTTNFDGTGNTGVIER